MKGSNGAALRQTLWRLCGLARVRKWGGLSVAKWDFWAAARGLKKRGAGPEGTRR